MYLKQFTCFGLIAFPLGLWHSVYCAVKYRMPFGYVVSFDESVPHYIGAYDKWSRFFRFERTFEYLAIREDRINNFADFNIPVTLVKYATFGDSHYYLDSRLTQVMGTCIFWINVVLFVLMPLMFVVWCLFRDGRLAQKMFILTAAGSSLYFYIKFCFKYTHVCSMNVRYIMCAVYIGCIAIAAAASEIQKRAVEKNAAAGSVCKTLVTVLPVLYAIAVIVLQAGMETLFL